MRWSCRVCASTALMRTAALPRGRDEPAEDFPAIDFGMWLRMAADGWEFAFLADTLGDYRIHDGDALGRVRAAAGAGLRPGRRDRRRG